MRLRKALASIVVCALLLAGLPFGVRVQAQSLKYSAVMSPVLYDSPADMISSVSVLEGFVDIDAFRQKMLTAAAECSEEVIISDMNIPESIVEYVADFIWYNMPEAFNIHGISYSYYGDILHSLMFTFRDFADTKAEYSSCFSEFKAAADKMLLGIENNDGLSDAEKALLLHDRLAVWNEYDYVTSSLIKHTAYGAFAKKASVCQGYAMAYMYLLQRVGIENYYCSSQALNHGWNIVFINNKPYHVDVTWDDMSWGETGRGFVGRVKHDNFLRSTAGIKSTGHSASDFDKTPVDTTYDNYKWQTSTTAVQLVENELYYIDNSAEKLIRFRNNKVLADVSDEWYASNGGIWSCDYACLSSVGNSLLYSIADGVYRYDIKTSVSTKVYEPALKKNYSVFGFTYQDGYIICDINNNPNTAAALSQEKVAFADPERKITGIEIMTLPTVTTFNMGDSSDFSGLTIRVKYSDNSSEVISSGFTLSGFSSASLGTVNVTVLYEGFRTSFSVKIVCGHKNKTNVDSVNATCISNGFTAGVYCNDCSKFISGHKKLDADANAHKWDSGVVSREATCSQEGVKIYTCTYDSSHTKTAAIPKDKSNHKNTEHRGEVKSTCTASGFTAGVYCKDCKTYISGHTSLDIVASAHKWDEGKITTEASCSTEGIITYTCAYNEAHKKTEGFGLAESNHINSIDIPELSPTCTEKGYAAGVYCNDCEKYLSGHEEIPAINHMNKTYVEAVVPDCTVPGCTAGVFCPDCMTYLEVSGEIPVDPAAHKWDDGAITTTASCDTNGIRTYTCEHNSEHIRTEKLGFNKDNHTDTVKIPAAAPTTEQVGYTEGVYCNGCDTFISGHKEIAKLQAEFTDGENAVVSGSFIKCNVKLTADALLKQASDGSVIKDKKGTPVTGEASLATGMSLTLPDGSSYELSCPGDVNGDGKITASDARFTLRASVNLEKIEQESAEFIAANINGGAITAADARLILRASVVLEDISKWINT